MKFNKPTNVLRKTTFEGGQAQHLTPKEYLRRSVMACMLFEKSFYESGQDVAARIAELVPKVDPKDCVSIALDAAEKMHLRHAPLLVVREMARYDTHKRYVSRTLQRIIRRPDQLTDFLALYWLDKKQPLTNKVKQGLAHAFTKFNEYELSKHAHNDRAIKLRDILFLSHAKPRDDDQAALWKRLISGELSSPDTWEVALSGGADKREVFERLMRENKLGALAYIRNLRNMRESGVDPVLMHQYASTLDVSKIFPWQFIGAAKTNPQLEPLIEPLLLQSCATRPKLAGTTIILVDVSGSMSAEMSGKSQLSLIDAACGLAILLREICSNPVVLSFSNKLVQCPPRHGFALRDAIVSSQPHSGTDLRAAITDLHTKSPFKTYDRIIVITDEQTSDGIATSLTNKAYVMNVAAYKHGVDYSRWKHISGFSDKVIDWIFEYERKFT